MITITNSSNNPALNQSIALILSADQKVPVTTEQLTPAKRINEQEGYAALAHHTLKASNTKLAARFEQELKEATAQFRKNHGETNLFKITDRLMRQYIREKALTQEQYRAIRDSAFGKTQLDSDRTMLGSVKAPTAKAGDTPVRALSTFYKKIETNAAASSAEFAQFRAAEAVISVEKWRERKLSGAIEKSAAPLTIKNSDEASIGGIPDGFLWKPKSDSDGKLVVLLPTAMSANAVNALTIRDPKSGKTLEVGRFAGIGNGGRLHFRFSKSGSNFPDGSVVEVRFTDGSTTQIKISDSAQRVE